MRKKFMIALVLLLCFTSLFKTSAIEFIDIYYWYSDGSNVWPWTSIPVISRSKIDGNHSSSITAGYINAINEWTAVSGIDLINLDESISPTDIKCWEGQRNTLCNGFSLTLTNEINGATYSSNAQTNSYYGIIQAYLMYYGAVKHLYISSSAVIYMVDQDVFPAWNEVAQYKNLYTHELGHALGWGGHSNEDSDVMYTFTTTTYELTYRDIGQISRFY